MFVYYRLLHTFHREGLFYLFILLYLRFLMTVFGILVFDRANNRLINTHLISKLISKVLHLNSHIHSTLSFWALHPLHGLRHGLRAANFGLLVVSIDQTDINDGHTTECYRNRHYINGTHYLQTKKYNIIL